MTGGKVSSPHLLHSKDALEQVAQYIVYTVQSIIFSLRYTRTQSETAGGQTMDHGRIKSCLGGSGRNHLQEFVVFSGRKKKTLSGQSILHKIYEVQITEDYTTNQRLIY
jgi:hypothetical protein